MLRNQVILDEWQRYIRVHGRNPTMTELAGLLPIGRRAVGYRMAKMALAGQVSYVPGRFRTTGRIIVSKLQ